MCSSTCYWWEVLFISLWIQVAFVPGIVCKDGTVSHLSREDVLLINDTQDLKCFTRAELDFTCFFETADNKTYDLLYKCEGLHGEGRCAMSVQRTEEGTFLQVCSFPEDDVFMYTEMFLKVVERNTDISLYSRTVSVEDTYFLDPPLKVSVHQNDQAGQLRVLWNPTDTFCQKVMHRIRYSSKGLGERTKIIMENKEHEGKNLDSLVPGEELQVQVSVKCDPGYWSRWSHPVQDMVPQSGYDISLFCYTSDLQNITCQWNVSKYGEEKRFTLFYKTCLSYTSTWTEWTECLPNENFSGRCHFVGDVSREVLVKLSGHPAPLSRTFYTQKFTLNNSIKTSPPSHLRGTIEKGMLCLHWEAPLLSLLAHLQYEVSYQTKGGEAWMVSSLDFPAKGTCLEIAADFQYRVKVRAKPKGSVYSGHWSDWSDVLTGKMPTDIGMFLVPCIPFLMIILMALLFVCLSKLKQYVWPPVPNLEKVLQGFLTEINGQKWDHSVISKQCSEETTSSVVEIMSEDNVSALEKLSQESSQLLSLEGTFSCKENVDWSPGTEIFPDYVTLNKDSTIICPKGNKYVYEQVGEKGDPVVEDALLQTCADVTPCLCTEYLNHSYLPPTEVAHKFTCKHTAARGPANLYTNFPCS